MEWGGWKSLLQLLQSLNEVTWKVWAECLVQNWHMINVLSLFFHPLTFRTWSKEKEVVSVPTSHLWISPQYAFIPTTAWLHPSSFLFLHALCFQREEASQARMVPSKGGGSTNDDPPGSTRPHPLLCRRRRRIPLSSPPSSLLLSYTSCLAPTLTTHKFSDLLSVSGGTKRNGGAEIGRLGLPLLLKSVSLAWASGRFHVKQGSVDLTRRSHLAGFSFLAWHFGGSCISILVVGGGWKTVGSHSSDPVVSHFKPGTAAYNGESASGSFLNVSHVLDLMIP